MIIEMEEREISFRDLVFEILLHWRGIILWMFIGGATLGIFSYIHQYRAAISKQTEKISLSELESKMTQIEQAAVKQVLVNEYSIEKWQSYMENSAFMALDASQVYQADLIFSVTVSEPSSNLASVYLDLLDTIDMYRFISNKIEDVTISDAQELIRVMNSSASAQKQETCSFHIMIIAGTKKECKAMSKAVQAYMDKLHKLIAETYGKHDMALLWDAIAATDSTSLLQEQMDKRNKIVYLDTETAEILDDFTETQSQYYQLQKNGNDMSPEVSAKRADTAKTAFFASLRSAVWGILFAAIIYIFSIFFLYIIDNRLRYTDDFKAFYQITVLGYIPAKRKTKTFFYCIDRWLYRQRDKRRHLVSPEKAVKLAAATIQMAAQNKGVRHIYGVTCGLMTEATARAGDKLRYILGRNSIEFQVVDNILYDAEAINLLSSSIKAAVLIEKAGFVQYDEIYRELEMLHLQKVDVLGFVMVE